MSEIVTLFIYIICTTIIGLSIMINREFTGEIKQFELTVSNLEVFFILFITIVGFFVAHFFYLKTKNKKKYLTKSKWVINVERFNYFLIIALVSQIVFVLNTRVGIVGSGATSGISFLFSLLGLSTLFNYYYFVCRSKRKIYILNILLFSVLQLLLGWNGFILNIALFEIHFYFKKKKHLSIEDALKVFCIPILGILVGAKLYQYTFALKFKQRFGAIYELTYFEGLINLVNRLTHITTSIGAYQNVQSIKKLYVNNDVLFPEIQGLFRPLTPRFLMPYKEFRTLNNLVMQSFYPDIVYFTSSNFGIFNYSLTLLYVGFIDFSLWLIVTIILFSFSRRLINSFEQYKGQLDFLYFLLVLNLLQIGSPETVFGYGDLKLIYVIPLLIVLKVIKLEKRR